MPVASHGAPAPPRLRPRHPPVHTVAELAARLGLPTPEGGHGRALLTGVTLDSRAVHDGDLYAALPGGRAHGADFAGDAARAGARAVLTNREGAPAAIGTGLPVLVVDDPRGVLGDLAAWLYGEPGHELLLTGVTGTNGKTTTTYLLDAVLRAAGRTTGLVGTVSTRVGDAEVPSVRTTPESPDLHALLAVMVESGVTACTMEVSSHALALHRVDGLQFDVAVFTNLSQDHLDFHADMEDYFAAKASLFTASRARQAVVGVDDAYGARLADLVERAGLPLARVSTALPPPAGPAPGGWAVTAVAPHPREAAIRRFTLRGPDGQLLDLTCPLAGDFNIQNAALAAVAALALGVPAHEVSRGLAAAPGVPGRMQRVTGPHGTAPLALVDYAHTPAAVASALQTLRPGTRGRLVIVLGAGGDRDPGKRVAMGTAAAQGADIVVVTDDNPRSEPPEKIRAAVLEGARGARAGAQVQEIADRGEAIRKAVAMLGPTDTLLVAGKGHEQGQEVGGVVHPFDDVAVLRAALQEWP